MKLGDALKTIDAGWIRKLMGYRVRYQRLEGEELVTGYSPDPDEPALDSEVSARRLAWKLWKTTGTPGEEVGENELVNLVVVDENDCPVKSYVTGEVEVFNPHDP